MTILRIVILFVIAAIAEIGGAWLIWQAVRENRGWWLALIGIVALGAYGFVAAFQPDANFGRACSRHTAAYSSPARLLGATLSTGSSRPCGTTSDPWSASSGPGSSSWRRSSRRLQLPTRRGKTLATNRVIHHMLG